jgi:hypothetical protein
MYVLPSRNEVGETQSYIQGLKAYSQHICLLLLPISTSFSARLVLGSTDVVSGFLSPQLSQFPANTFCIQEGGLDY